MKLTKIVVVSATSLVAASVLALPTLRKPVADAFKLKPGSAADKAGCALCHKSMADLKNFNPFGKDFKALLTAAKTKSPTPAILKKLGAMDSDKDGVKNAAEIAKGTLPGDPKSK